MSERLVAFIFFCILVFALGMHTVALDSLSKRIDALETQKSK